VSTLVLFFYLFSSLALVSSIMVLLTTNPIYSALFLILVFVNASFLVLLLDLEFLAFIFVLIYVGAIMVLFLFILMMLDIKQPINYLSVYYSFFVSGLLLIFLSGAFLYALSQDLVSPLVEASADYFNWFHLVNEYSTIRTIGLYMYTYYSFFFIMAGVILLIAMIGAISLTLGSINVEKKCSPLYEQLNSKAQQSMFYVQ
jgi:NADH-quinone oxidoreductase subunit J